MFNSKFSTGILKHPGYNVGGGIPEAMLMGAAVGGGTALLTGEDPLAGALTGGAMGGVGGAIFGPGASGATSSEMTAGATALQNQAVQGQNAINALNNAVVSSPTNFGLTTAEINPAAQYYASAVTPTASAVTPATTAATNMYGNLAPDFAPQALDSTIARNLSVVQPAGEEFAKQFAAQQAPSLGVAQTAAATPQSKGLLSQAADWYSARSPMEKVGLGIAGGVGLNAIMNPMAKVELPTDEASTGIFSKFDKDKFERYAATPSVYKPTYAAFAEGGIADMAGGGMGRNQMYPQALQDSTQYATPSQMPTSAQVVNADYEAKTDPYLGTPIGMASGGIAGYNLGGYAAGGNPRLLKGPGDGMSDNIPATIGDKQPARLADGEFVVPADVVSHLGNGSTDAGAKHLYAMMDKVRKARTGNKKQGKEIKAEKFLPA
jgi:hypothetical protein